MKKYLKWIGVLIFTIFIAITQWSILALIVMRYGAMILVFLGVSLVFYYFFYDAILQKCKSCRKLKSFAYACILAAFCIFAYKQINKPPDVVQMQEDVLYILPKSHVNPDDIYDGSKNDPNLKQDTIEHDVK